ncbi:MAG: class I SAM-dependent methyltransferase [Acidimicrobiia bacterium]|nr:class I SAM-dependent methyltransferase [Acidimicrobiia bacterium]
MTAFGRRTSGNLQKHETGNPLQRYFIDRFHAEVIRLLGTVQPDAVLDLGCGEGFVLEALVEAGFDAELVGIDNSEDAVAHALERVGSQAEILCDDVRELSDLPRRFDVVMMLEVLEHLDDPNATLRLLGSLTTGHVLLSVPREPYFRGMNVLRLKNVRRLGNDPEHVQHWTRSGFERLVGNRFSIVGRGRAFPWTLLLLEPTATASET